MTCSGLVGQTSSLLGQNRAYEPAALSIISLALTWALIGLLQYIGRGQERSQLAGIH